VATGEFCDDLYFHFRIENPAMLKSDKWSFLDNLHLRNTLQAATIIERRVGESESKDVPRQVSNVPISERRIADFSPA
jgi:hypothetical protein